MQRSFTQKIKQRIRGIKGLILVILAVLVLVLALAPGLSRPTNLLAQESNFPTLTPTFTETPTITSTFGPSPTPTATATKVKRIVNELTFPHPGDAVAGVTNLIGTALTQRF